MIESNFHIRILQNIAIKNKFLIDFFFHIEFKSQVINAYYLNRIYKIPLSSYGNSRY